MVVTQKQPIGLAKSVSLYKYQLDAVNWMKSVEEDIGVGASFVSISFPSPISHPDPSNTNLSFLHPAGFDYTDLIPWSEGRSSLLFDATENNNNNNNNNEGEAQSNKCNMKAVRVEEVARYRKKCYPRGGILADEMGLGYVSYVLFWLYFFMFYVLCFMFYVLCFIFYVIYVFLIFVLGKPLKLLVYYPPESCCFLLFS